MKILISGGLGFIGAVTLRKAKERGHDVMVIDDRHGMVSEAPPDVRCYPIGIGDERVLDILRKKAPDLVLHLAATSSVIECERRPVAALKNNVQDALSFVTSALSNGSKVVVSSSCAVYGLAGQVPVPEDYRAHPKSWYGWTKLCLEEALKRTWGAKEALFLRLSNIIGASYGVGQKVDEGNRIIPMAFEAARKRCSFEVHGADWPTPDGSCVRDYLHVDDAAEALLQTGEVLVSGSMVEKDQVFNVGSGLGSSVLEILSAAEKASGCPIERKVGPRRAGDAPSFIAKINRIKEVFGWSPRKSLSEAVSDAWEEAQAHA